MKIPIRTRPLIEPGPEQSRVKAEPVKCAPPPGATITAATTKSLTVWAVPLFGENAIALRDEILAYLTGMTAAEREDCLTHMSWGQIMTNGIDAREVTDFSKW